MPAVVGAFSTPARVRTPLETTLLSTLPLPYLSHPDHGSSSYPTRETDGTILSGSSMTGTSGPFFMRIKPERLETENTVTTYDAIVIGARCAGSPTAMLLARQGYKVLLLEKAIFP